MKMTHKNRPPIFSLILLVFFLSKSELIVQAQSNIGTSQPDNFRYPRFEHLTVKDGLSQGMARAIHQDRKGFLWFGSYDGLNRYDGYNFRIFRHDPFDSTSISGNIITAIAEDQNGRLWIGTERSGLNCFDPVTETFRSFKHDPENPNSLSHNEIFSICVVPSDSQRIGPTGKQEQRTTIWIGTRVGLNKLILSISTSLNTGSAEGPSLSGAEGHSTVDYTITKYFHDPEDSSSLSYNQVRTMLIDRFGTLWIGAVGGLNKCDLLEKNQDQPERFQRVLFTDGASDDPMYNTCTALYEDSKGAIWIGMVNGFYRLEADPQIRAAGQFRFFSIPEKIKKKDNVLATAVHGICEDARGRLWLVTPGRGLILFDPQINSFQHVQSQKDDPFGLNFYGLSFIYRDRSDVIWIGTGGFGLNKYDPRKQSFQSFIINEQEHHLESSENGLKKIGIEFNRKRHAFLPSCAYLFDFIPHSGTYLLLKTIPKLSGRIVKDPFDNFWLCSQGSLLRHHPDMPYAKAGELSDAEGITNFLPDSLQHFRFSDIIIYSENKIWIIGFTKDTIALCSLDDKTELFSTFYFPTPESINNYLNHFFNGFRDIHGVFWFASSHGLYRIDVASHSASIYLNDPGNKRSLNQNNLRSILQDPIFPERFIWIGTNGGGINRFEIASETFIHYTEEDGLPNHVIYGILADGKGNLWMSTNRGLSNAVLHAETRDIMGFHNYGTKHGLQGDEFDKQAQFKTEYGDMIFGGVNGITIFHPDSVKTNPHIPPVVITGLRINHKLIIIGEHIPGAITETSEIMLPYSQNALDFEFAALDFSVPEQNLYSCKLENLETEWRTPSYDRRVSYVNLDPGKYVFRVRASNNDGVWNKNGASIKITITPPWWRTPWAYVAFAFLFIATVYGIFRSELRRHQLKLNLLQKQSLAEEKDRLAEKLIELDRMKSRFFANISHEFRTPLTLILGPLTKLFSKIRDKKMKEDLILIQHNADQLSRLINDLLDLAKLESFTVQLLTKQQDVVHLVTNCVNSFSPLAEQKRIKLRFISEVHSLMLYIDRNKIEKVINNLLTNAVKFTPENGKIDVNIFKPSESFEHSKGLTFVQIQVKDGGIGIPKEQLPKIFDRFFQANDTSTRNYGGTGIGLALVKEFVELHHGKIDVESLKDKGSIFNIYLPIGKDHLQKEEIADYTDIDTPGSSVVANTEASYVDPLIVQNGCQYENNFFETDKGTGNRQEVKLFPNDVIIQIIEDNSEMRTYIRSLLPKAYKVIEAGDGKKGIEQAQQIIPDLIICDIMMPGKNGYQVCYELKNDEKTSHVPIILLTAKAEQKDKINGLENRADAYIIKPFDSKELLIQVKNLIELRRKLREKFSLGQFPDSTDTTFSDNEHEFIGKAIAIVEDQMENPGFSTTNLAKSLFMSRSQLHRKIKALTNQSSTNFMNQVRLNKATALLKQTDYTISEIAYKVGFEDANYFTRIFRKYYGKSPREFRE